MGPGPHAYTISLLLIYISPVLFIISKNLILNVLVKTLKINWEMLFTQEIFWSSFNKEKISIF